MHYKFSPYYCSLQISPNLDKCVTGTTEKSTVYIETAKDMYFNLTREFVMENLVLDFSRSTSATGEDGKEKPITDPD